MGRITDFRPSPRYREFPAYSRSLRSSVAGLCNNSGGAAALKKELPELGVDVAVASDDEKLNVLQYLQHGPTQDEPWANMRGPSQL